MATHFPRPGLAQQANMHWKDRYEQAIHRLERRVWKNPNDTPVFDVTIVASLPQVKLCNEAPASQGDIYHFQG